MRDDERPSPSRRVAAWCGVSLDGFSSGPDGPMHDTWLHRTAVRPSTEAHFEGVWRRASTVLIGRRNAEGFGAVWPGLSRSPDLSESSRAYGRFLTGVEKVVFSRSLPTDAMDGFAWDDVRVASDLEGEVRALRDGDGGDVLVQNSASIIQQLLRLDLLDDLRLMVVPVLLGGGLRLLDDVGAGEWDLAQSTTTAEGVLFLHYARHR
ncbi:MAG: dihydrofolate reductase family protein [Nocardioidaceae bacterium]|nr:dihydrofolate reductase family protein [Nocardioidaceae bacterium]